MSGQPQTNTQTETETDLIHSQTDAAHALLRDRVEDLRANRHLAETLLEGGASAASQADARLRVESAHARQNAWYAILFLTLLLIARFVSISSTSNGTADVISTTLLAVVIVLFVTVTGMSAVNGASAIIACIVALIVAVYSARHVNRRMR